MMLVCIAPYLGHVTDVLHNNIFHDAIF